MGGRPLRMGLKVDLNLPLELQSPLKNSAHCNVAGNVASFFSDNLKRSTTSLVGAFDISRVVVGFLEPSQDNDMISFRIVKTERLNITGCQ